MVPQVFQTGNSNRVGRDLDKGVLSSPQSGSRVGGLEARWIAINNDVKLILM